MFSVKEEVEGSKSKGLDWKTSLELDSSDAHATNNMLSLHFGLFFFASALTLCILKLKSVVCAAVVCCNWHRYYPFRRF